MRARSISSASTFSVVSVPDSDSGSDFAPSPPPSTGARGTQNKRAPVKRKSESAPAPNDKSKAGPSKIGGGADARRAKGKLSSSSKDVEDIEDLGDKVARPHGVRYHAVDDIVRDQERLLEWFTDVREKRGMPWRKPYDPALSIEEKGQRAYEIWVSEVMLQQTQVTTVIAYWRRWIDKWPTVADLAQADVEEVNAMWRGLGYYRRARSLLAGAKTVMGHKKYKGRLPDDPAVLEKEVDGVGRYTAGAICSMAYGIRTPIVDGNIHRLLTRLLAVHAPQTAPSTIKLLWSAAEQLVGLLPVDEDRDGIAGDWNQALMELGSQICKPVSPDCGVCPLQSACKAYAEVSNPPPPPTDEECALCAPIPAAGPSGSERIPSVQVFPMKKEKKVSREEEESVLVLEWQGAEEDKKWLFVKRPEKGLLAGLFEPPTTPVSTSSSPAECLRASVQALEGFIDLAPTELERLGSDARYVGSIAHIFSHINMTYHIHHALLTGSNPPDIRVSDGARPAVWLDQVGVEGANVGTGVKKVWCEVYGSWGRFDRNAEEKPTRATKTGRGPKTGRKNATAKRPLGQSGDLENGRVVKKIMMPMMPVRKVVQ